VNIVLTYSLNKFTKFERHKSKTDEVISLTLKLSIAEFINTAVLTLIINGSLDRLGGQKVLFNNSGVIFGFFTGSIGDYDTTW
jgi:hypothetical protein